MAAWPPRTGVANVYEGVIIARSSGDTEIALTFSATEASNRPILMARARATSLPAVVEVRYQVDDSEKPGCDGVAARLPKDPGVQKLSPVSSAQAMSGASASAAATALRAKRCRHAPCRQEPSRTPDPVVPIAPLWSPWSCARPGRRGPRRVGRRRSAPLYEQPRARARPRAQENRVGTKNVGDCCHSETPAPGASVRARRCRDIHRRMVFATVNG